MDYKEEYQKALERAKKGLPIDEVFPELKESEDERIRKELIGMINECTNWAHKKEYVKYLGKQKEHKTADLSELMVHKEPYIVPVPTPMVADEQKPAEWSEEDKEMFGRCIANAKKHIPIPDKNGHLDKIEERVDKELVDWLKELFFNVHWKPSEEQIQALGFVLEYHVFASHKNKEHIRSLYDDLKKL